jgi:hypothetical protein
MKTHAGPYDEILGRLNAVVRAKAGYDFLRGAMQALAAAALLLVLAVVVEQASGAGQTFRFWIFTSLVALAAAVAAWLLWRPALFFAGLLPGPAPLETAKFVGSKVPAVRDRLVDAMEMFPEKERLAGHYSPELIDAAFAAVWSDVREVDFTSVVDGAPARRALRSGAIAAAAVALLWIVLPGWFGASLGRILHYDTAFAASDYLELSVHPGDIEVVRGQPVEVTVRAAGRAVDRIVLNTRPEGRIDFETAELPDTSGGRGDAVFTARLEQVKSTTEYFASAGGTESKRYVITVVDRPIVRSFRLAVTPPAYTRLPQKGLDENVGDVAALPGSTVRVELKAGKPLAAAQIVFHDSVRAAMAVSGDAASGTFRIHGTDRYRFRLEDDDGLTNPDPITYDVRAIPDEYPMIEFVTPGKNIDIAENASVDLVIRIRDDYGFSRLRLYSRMEQSKYEEPSKDYSSIDLPVGAAGRAEDPGGADAGIGRREVRFRWDLSKMSLVPEDVVGYYAEVLDNDNVSGPKSARTPSFLLRLPSLEEVLADVDKSSDRSVEEMQKMSEELQTLKESLDELNREVKKQRDRVDWQQQKKAEQLAQRYEQLRQKAEKQARETEDLVRKMDENNLLSETTLQKYQELQKLMEELNSDELKEALKKLQESMKQMTPEQMRDAMNKLSTSEEQFRKSLERTVELLKRIQIEQKLDELIRRAGDLKEREESISKKAADDAAKRETERLSQEQKDLSKDAQSLEKESSELGTKMEDFAKEMPASEMNKASESLKQNAVPQKMQSSASKMEAGQMQEARSDQQEASKDLTEFQKQMEEVRDALREKQQQQIVNEMKRQMQNLVDLSKNQEAVKDETSTMETNSQRFRDAARQQQETREGLTSVASAMSELSKKTFAVGPEMGREIGNAMKQMSDAMDQMEQRNPGESSRRQREAMGSMNRAAMMMQGALDGMMNGEGQMGMAGLMGRLGQMSGQQQGINEGTQQAAGQGQGGQNGMTAEQMAAYGRLAGQQGELGKSLQQLSQEAKESGDLSKILGDLDRVAQEMQEVQTNLSQGNVNPEVMQKQDRILSRLLESQKSMRERDYEKRRTAESGTTTKRAGPAEIDFGTQEGKNALREELFQVREGKYSRDYEELIRKYFEQLEQPGPAKPK